MFLGKTDLIFQIMIFFSNIFLGTLSLNIKKKNISIEWLAPFIL